MHGSIDWFFCHQEYCRARNLVFPVENVFLQNYCSAYFSKVKPLLIPPVINKQYEKYPLMNTLWNIAINELNISNKIIIWGYSFPNTDYYSTWLVRQSSKKYDTISIINPEIIRGKKHITWNREFKKKIESLFIDKVYNSRYLHYYENYVDYIKNYSVSDKYNLTRR